MYRLAPRLQEPNCFPVGIRGQQIGVLADSGGVGASASRGAGSSNRNCKAKEGRKRMQDPRTLSGAASAVDNRTRELCKCLACNSLATAV